MASFFAELRRRNVVKVGLAYAASGWALIEIASVLLPIFKAPEWILQFLATAIILGIPVTLLLAWVYELTPEGIRRSDNFASDEPASRPGGRGLDFLIIGVLSVAVVMFSLDKFLWNAAKDGTAGTTSRKSIAVLPFVNLSALEEDAYFADGMHDELLTRLARIGSLKVISRTSVLRYRNSELPLSEIAKQLGVAAIMEGQVQRAAGQVRINVKLIDAFREENVWAESFDRALNTENLFAIQSEITEKISGALKAALTEEEKARIESVPTANLQAYQFYLKGRQLLPLRTVKALEEGRNFAERSVQLDPNFAPALALLADSLHLLHEYAGLPVDESLLPAIDLINRAIAIDPNLAEAYAVLGEIRRHQGDYEAGEQAFEKAIELAPGDAQAYNWFSLLRADQGRREEELELIQSAHSLNPLVPVIHHNLAWALHELGRDEEAWEEYTRLTDLHPDFALGWQNMGWFHRRVGRMLEALRALRRYEQLSPDTWENVYICRVLTDLDDLEAAGPCYLKVLAAHPEDPRVLLLSSYGYLAEGDFENARRVIRKADALEDPDWPMWVASDWPEWIVAEAVDTGDFELGRQILAAASPGWLTAASPDLSGRALFGPTAAATVLLEFGNGAQAQRLLEATLVEIGRRPPIRLASADGHADVAAYALLGDHDNALSSLEDVARTGYLVSWRLLEIAPQFASIREDPRFEQALGALRAKAQEQHAVAAQEGLLDSATR